MSSGALLLVGPEGAGRGTALQWVSQTLARRGEGGHRPLVLPLAPTLDESLALAFSAAPDPEPTTLIIPRLTGWLGDPPSSVAAAVDRLTQRAHKAPLRLAAATTPWGLNALGALGSLGDRLTRAAWPWPAPTTSDLAHRARTIARRAERTWAPGALDALLARAQVSPVPGLEAAWLLDQMLGLEGVELNAPECPGLGQALQEAARRTPDPAGALALLASTVSLYPEHPPGCLTVAAAALKTAAGSTTSPDILLSALSTPEGSAPPLLARGPDGSGALAHPGYLLAWPALVRHRMAEGGLGPARATIGAAAPLARSLDETLSALLPPEADGLSTVRLVRDTLKALRATLGEDPGGEAFAEAVEQHLTEGDRLSATRPRAALDAYREGVEAARGAVRRGGETSRARRTLSRALLRMVDAALNAGDHGAAVEAVSEALRIRSALARATPDALIHQRDLTVAQERAADVALAGREVEAATRWLETAHQLRLGLVSRWPRDARLMHDLVVILTRQGELAATLSQWPQAVSAYDEARRVARAMLAAHPLDRAAAEAVWSVERRLGAFYLVTGQHRKAREALVVALHVADRQADRYTPQWSEAAVETLIALAEVAGLRGHVDEARGHLEEAIEAARPLSEAEGGARRRALATARTLTTRGHLELASGRAEAAPPALEQAQRLWRSLVLTAERAPPQHTLAGAEAITPRQGLVSTTATLMDAWLTLKAPTRAQQALDTAREALGTLSPVERATLQGRCADLAVACGDLDAALAAAEVAARAAETSRRPGDPLGARQAVDAWRQLRDLALVAQRDGAARAAAEAAVIANHAADPRLINQSLDGPALLDAVTAASLALRDGARSATTRRDRVAAALNTARLPLKARQLARALLEQTEASD